MEECEICFMVLPYTVSSNITLNGGGWITKLFLLIIKDRQEYNTIYDVCDSTGMESQR